MKEKLKTSKVGEVWFRGIRFEIKQRCNEQMTYAEYVLSMRWSELDEDGWRHEKTKQIAKYWKLYEATDRLAEIVRINS